MQRDFNLAQYGLISSRMRKQALLGCIRRLRHHAAQSRCGQIPQKQDGAGQNVTVLFLLLPVAKETHHSCNFLSKEELCLSPSVVLLSLRCCWTCAAGTQHVASATWRRCSAEVTSSSDYSELNLSVYVLPCYVWVADRSISNKRL